MAHCAKIENGIVTQVIVVQDTYSLKGGGSGAGGKDYLTCEEWCEKTFGGTWKQTSYNTNAGHHPENRPLRKNYAGIGYTYDTIRDAFIPPKPSELAILDEETCQWVEPSEVNNNG